MIARLAARVREIRWLPLALTALAVCAYGWQSWNAAHSQLAIIDESAYLSKGYLFVTGAYRPFEDGGPLMNKPPLVFQIFGVAQLLFGPGLRTGRMFALALGLLSLLGIWATARRVAGPWAPVPAVWLIALNPALIKGYSLAASEVLAACLLSWTLFFALGRERRQAERMIAAGLAGILLLVRINLAPVPALLLVYFAWRHGWKQALAPALAFAAVMLAGYAPYWPEILRVWEGWFPFVRWLDPYRIPQTGQADPFATVWPLRVRLDSLEQTFRIHMAVMLGAIASLLTLRRRSDSPLGKERVFLLWLFLILFLAHAVASLGFNYCVYCLNAYMGFCYPAGALAIALCLPGWGRGRVRAALSLAWAVALILSPTALLAGLALPADSPCPADLLSEYDRIAADLARVIPPGSAVYWTESDAIVLLLQVPGAVTYPPLLNDGFSYRIGGDAATLLRYGLWNERLAAVWLGISDVVVTEQPLRGQRVEVLRTDPIPSCGATGAWYVYR